jgi:hypothetical protein
MDNNKLTKEAVQEKLATMTQTVTLQHEMLAKLENLPDSQDRKTALTNLFLLNDDARKLWAVDTLLLAASSNKFSYHERREISQSYEKISEDIKDVKNKINELLGIRPMVWERIDATKNNLLKNQQMLLKITTMEEGTDKKRAIAVLSTINQTAQQFCLVDNMHIINKMPDMGLEDMSKQEIKQIKEFYKASLNEFKQIDKEIRIAAGLDVREENKKTGLLSKLFK